MCSQHIIVETAQKIGKSDLARLIFVDRLKKYAQLKEESTGSKNDPGLASESQYRTSYEGFREFPEIGPVIVTMTMTGHVMTMTTWTPTKRNLKMKVVLKPQFRTHVGFTIYTCADYSSSWILLPVC